MMRPSQPSAQPTIKQQFENAQMYQARSKKKWEEHLAKEDEMQQRLVELQQRLAVAVGVSLE